MKVLILGASGFIGLPTAQALSRAGYAVYGQTRSSEKAKRLAAEEIFPIVCEPDSDKWHHLIPTLDVIIETLGGNVPETSQNILRATIEAAKSLRPIGAPKLSFIYTSGTWVQGENGREIVSDTTPVYNSVEIGAWRVGHEQEVIGSQVINGIIIRPSVLFGHSGTHFGSFFDKVKETGKVTWPGKPSDRLTLLHHDDLADLMVRASEKAQLIGGLIFDASNDATESTDGFLQRVVEITGVEGPYEFIEPKNLFEVALSTQAIIRPYLARSLLGWQPRKPGLVDGLAMYYSAYQATNDSP